MGKASENEEAHTLFQEAMRGVKPLQCDKVPPPRPQLTPFPQQRYLDEALVYKDMLSENYDSPELETGEELLFIRPGVQYSILQKLRRGYFSVTAELDLHGMVVPVARVEVTNFLRYCRNSNIRCARIVHGKGYGSWQKQPILKNKLNYWLRQRDEVLAFCSARPTDGGTGAIYVLLKKRA